MTNLVETRAAPAPSAIVPSFTEADGDLGATIRAAHRGVSIHPVSRDTQEAARMRLEALAPFCAPGQSGQMLAWLARLAPAVVNPPLDAREIRSRSESIWDLCGRLPCGVWCEETRRSWLIKIEDGKLIGKYWPCPSELYAHLSAFARNFQLEKAGCEMILAVSDQDPRVPTSPSDADREAERDAVATMLAAWRARDIPKRKDLSDDVRPLYPSRVFSDEALLEIHSLQEVHGETVAIRALGKARADMLRAKLGIGVSADAS